MCLFSFSSGQQPPPAATIETPQPASTSAADTPKQGGVATAAPKQTVTTQTAPPIADTVEIQGKTPPAAEPKKAPAPPENSKPLFQQILDFFKNLYQKFMDFFTPTSKEAIEKSLVKAASKQRKYLDRISLQEALQSPEKCSPELQESLKALSGIQRETILQDGEKAAKKLEALTPKIEKLYSRYEKLVSATTAPTTAAEKEATPTPEAATKKAAAAESAENSAKNAANDATEKTSESLEKGLKEFMENLAQQGEEAFNKMKQESPEVFEVIQKLLKGFLK